MYNYLLKNLSFIKITIVLAIVVLSSLNMCWAENGTGENGAESVVSGLNEAANKGFLGQTGDSDIEDGNGLVVSLPGAIGKIIGFALSFLGFAFFLLMIYGGFIWMFARGNDQEVQKAKDLIQSAIIGLIIVLLAYSITIFVGNLLIGGNGKV